MRAVRLPLEMSLPFNAGLLVLKNTKYCFEHVVGACQILIFLLQAGTLFTVGGKTKPKFPTTNSSRGSSCTIGFFAETTRSWRRKLGSNQIPRRQSAKLVKIYQIPFNYHSILVENMSHVNKACGPFSLNL
nr:PREDICTED: uncharacterized protein LOC102264850 [Bos mutus]